MRWTNYPKTYPIALPSIYSLTSLTLLVVRKKQILRWNYHEILKQSINKIIFTFETISNKLPNHLFWHSKSSFHFHVYLFTVFSFVWLKLISSDFKNVSNFRLVMKSFEITDLTPVCFSKRKTSSKIFYFLLTYKLFFFLEMFVNTRF